MALPHIFREGRLEVISGELGSGKTGCGVELAYDLIALGGTVYTNVECWNDREGKPSIAEEWRRRLASEGLEFDPSRLVRLEGTSLEGFWKQLKRGSDECVVMCLLDEALLDFKAKTQKKSVSEEMFNFMVMCRKLDIYLLFIAADAQALDMDCRRLLTVEHACRNMKNERLFGMAFPMDIYIRVRFKVINGKVHHKIDSETMFGLRAWGLYSSKALLGRAADDFLRMETAKRQKLRKIKKPSSGALVGLAAAAAAFLCVI